MKEKNLLSQELNREIIPHIKGKKLIDLRKLLKLKNHSQK